MPSQNFSHLKARSSYSGDESAPRGRFDHLNDGGPALATSAQILRAAAKARSATTAAPTPSDPTAAAVIAAGAKRRGISR